MLGINFHANSQWDINLEYKNRGNHGFDIAFTYHFEKPKPEVITRIVEVPETGPTFYDGIIILKKAIPRLAQLRKTPYVN